MRKHFNVIFFNKRRHINTCMCFIKHYWHSTIIKIRFSIVNFGKNDLQSMLIIITGFHDQAYNYRVQNPYNIEEKKYENNC